MPSEVFDRLFDQAAQRSARLHQIAGELAHAGYNTDDIVEMFAFARHFADAELALMLGLSQVATRVKADAEFRRKLRRQPPRPDLGTLIALLIKKASSW
jgi:hypothetical protein